MLADTIAAMAFVLAVFAYARPSAVLAEALDLAVTTEVTAATLPASRSESMARQNSTEDKVSICRHANKDTVRQDNKRQDKTRQDKTRQDKTRQDKTTNHKRDETRKDKT